MRATFAIYEHPDWSSEESKYEHSKALYAVVGALSLGVASTIAVYRFTSFGKSLQERFVLK